MMKSPIAQQPETEDISLGSQSQFPSGYNSYAVDGPGHTTIGGASAPSQSMTLGVEKVKEPTIVAYPRQKLLHHLDPVSVMYYSCLYACSVPERFRVEWGGGGDRFERRYTQE